eukprot:GHVS01064773.1.p1 GENE.GHVS01064773.1~~GHVS01064773.1.p1  ORF type:complete len:304 (+),score=22.69 GHVS01064773.1:218-1129(+)
MFVMTEPIQPSDKYREALLHWAFESRGAEGLLLVTQPWAALEAYSQHEDITTGCVIDVGHSICQVGCFAEGQLLDTCAIKRIPLAGNNVDEQLRHFLSAKTASMISMKQIADMKHRLCRVSADIERDLRIAKETRVYQEVYDITRGSANNTSQTVDSVLLEAERFMAPEILFNPGMFSTDLPSLAELVWSNICGAPMDCRKDLYRNVLLSGGTTMIPGFAARLQLALVGLRKRIAGPIAPQQAPVVTNHISVRVRSLPDQNLIVYQGACVIAQNEQCNREMWLKKSQFEEYGANLIIRKIGGR